MSKPKDFPAEELLDYAQAYLYSSLTLAYQLDKKAPFETFMNHGKGYVLCSHFLMAHGVELYIKFLIKLLKSTPPANTHKLKNLIIFINPLLKKQYKREIFNEKELKLINYLDRYEKFRYPTDKQWNIIPDIFVESEKWSKKRVENLIKNFDKLKDKLNSLGYKITRKLYKT